MRKKCVLAPGMVWLLFVLPFFSLACQVKDPEQAVAPEVKVQASESIRLRYISAEEAAGHLRVLNLEANPSATDSNSIAVAGSDREIQMARALLDVIDDVEIYKVDILAPASHLRQLPTNRQITEIVGHVEIGTFDRPPVPSKLARVIIDVYNEDIVVVAPRLLRNDIMAVINLWEELPWQPVRVTRAESVTDQGSGANVAPDRSTPQGDLHSQAPAYRTLPEKSGITIRRGPQAFAAQESQSEQGDASGRAQVVSTVVETVSQPIPADASEPAAPAVLMAVSPFANGEDILELDLPEQLDLLQLIDLVGQHLDLDFMYDPDQMQGQSVSLKLHGKLQGELRIKDLYPLLESALRFKGFAMTRHQDNVVVIRPLAEALRADPKLVNPRHETDDVLQPGDIVVTRVFQLRHLETNNAATLVSNMELATAVSPIQETRSLIITGYAESLNRVAQLLHVIDKPGQRKIFRYRDLKFAQAENMAMRIRDLALKVGNLPVHVVPTETRTPGELRQNYPTPSPAQNVGSTLPPDADSGEQSVYLDIDQRINRIFMVGPEQQLAVVENLIDAFDVPSRDGRTLGLYPVYRLKASYVQWKLQELGLDRPEEEFLPSTRDPRRVQVPGQNPSADGMNAMEPAPAMPDAEIVVLENINALLVNAREQEHQRIASLIDYLDMPPQDMRDMRVYEIEYVDAQDVKETLEALLLTPPDKPATASAITFPTNSAPNTNPQFARPAAVVEEQPAHTETQIVVLKASNSLLVNTSPDQHDRIAKSITFIDRQIRSQAIPYEIYFLENQEPESLAQVLQKLISETITRDQEGKVQEVTIRLEPEDDIVVVPDASTFSLVVYANRRNQEWISKMITSLDRPSSQVLIDATLVEITKTDEFTYDLNLITGIPDLVTTSGLMDPLKGDITAASIIQTLQTSGRSSIAELQSNSGVGNGFYGDEHVMLLLNIMESKNYGRVLAKPKILVNDNETGTISTTDTTFIETASQSVLPGNTEAIITSLDYTGYDAGITLEITPHISQDDLLRLEVSLNRTDFLPTEGEKPPNNTSSDIGTVVTIPDGSTIILGGMLRVNQTKGGKKVPGLGDLPLLGALFRSTDNTDSQKRLYIFVKAEILRPGEAMAAARSDLQRISDRHREAFEESERGFQETESWPGVRPRMMEPEKVLSTD